jgi:hypothetical protein
MCRIEALGKELRESPDLSAEPAVGCPQLLRKCVGELGS